MQLHLPFSGRWRVHSECSLSPVHMCSVPLCPPLSLSALFLYDCEGWIERGQHDLSVEVKGQLLRIASHLPPC